VKDREKMALDGSSEFVDWPVAKQEIRDSLK
jgi:hypothetical protein